MPKTRDHRFSYVHGRRPGIPVSPCHGSGWASACSTSSVRRQPRTVQRRSVSFVPFLTGERGFWPVLRAPPGWGSPTARRPSRPPSRPWRSRCGGPSGPRAAAWTAAAEVGGGREPLHPQQRGPADSLAARLRVGLRSASAIRRSSRPPPAGRGGRCGSRSARSRSSHTRRPPWKATLVWPPATSSKVREGGGPNQ